jgi:hypothetical protein
MAPRLFDGLADDGEIAVQEKDDIVGQLRFLQSREIAQIAEENGDLLFPARPGRLGVRRQVTVLGR